nr:MFS transporter [Micromonospora sp. DSM 115978]
MSATIPATPVPTKAPDKGLWHNSDFLKFWFGESLSLLGTQVAILALPLTAILALDASDQAVGLLRFAQLAPYIGLSMLFGVWVDRVRRRNVMLWSNLVRIVLIGLVPLLYVLDALTVPLLLVIACAIGVAAVLFDLSWMSYVPVLVKDSKHYVEASSKMGISTSTAEVAGPGIAGALVTLLTAPIALVVNAFGYLVSVISLLLIRAEEPRPAVTGTRRHFLSELREGLVWVFRDPILRWLALIGFCCNFSMNTVWTMFLLHATRDLRLSSSLIGFVFGAASVGGLIGAVVSRSLILRFPLGRVYLIAQTGLLLGPILIVLAMGPTPAKVGMFVLSFFTTYLGLGVAGVIIVSLRQTTTPHSLMARMTGAFRTLLFGGGALGGLTAGLLSGAIGARNALIVATVASAAVVIGLIISPVSRLRELPPAVADPVPAGSS